MSDNQPAEGQTLEVTSNRNSTDNTNDNEIDYSALLLRKLKKKKLSFIWNAVKEAVEDEEEGKEGDEGDDGGDESDSSSSSALSLTQLLDWSRQEIADVIDSITTLRVSPIKKSKFLDVVMNVAKMKNENANEIAKTIAIVIGEAEEKAIEEIERMQEKVREMVGGGGGYKAQLLERKQATLQALAERREMVKQEVDRVADEVVRKVNGLYAMAVAEVEERNREMDAVGEEVDRLAMEKERCLADTRMGKGKRREVLERVAGEVKEMVVPSSIYDSP